MQSNVHALLHQHLWGSSMHENDECSRSCMPCAMLTGHVSHVQRWDEEHSEIEIGVFLGMIAALTFRGSFKWEKASHCSALHIGSGTCQGGPRQPSLGLSLLLLAAAVHTSACILLCYAMTPSKICWIQGACSCRSVDYRELDAMLLVRSPCGPVWVHGLPLPVHRSMPLLTCFLL